MLVAIRKYTHKLHAILDSTENKIDPTTLMKPIIHQSQLFKHLDIANSIDHHTTYNIKCNHGYIGQYV